MNTKAILEIGRMLHIDGLIMWRVKDPNIILDSYEYQMFKKEYPELTRLAEN